MVYPLVNEQLDPENHQFLMEVFQARWLPGSMLIYQRVIIYQIYPIDIPIASKSIVDGHQHPVIVDGSDGRCLISIGLKTNGIIPKQSLGCRTEDFVLGPKSDYELLGVTVFFCSLCWFKVKPVKKGLNILWFLCQSHCFFFAYFVVFSFCFPAFLMVFPTCFIKDQTHGTPTVDFLHVKKQSNSSIFFVQINPRRPKTISTTFEMMFWI